MAVCLRHGTCCVAHENERTMIRPLLLEKRYPDWRMALWRTARLLSSATSFLRSRKSIVRNLRSSVCFITEAPGFGGTEVHTIGLIRSLIDRGHTITLLCCNNCQYDERLAPEIRENKLTLVHTDLTVNSTAWDDAKRWSELLQRVQSDVLIFPKGGNNLGNLTFALLCRKYFGTIYWIEHLEAEAPQPFRIGNRSSLTDIRSRFVKWLRSLNADRIIAVSDKVGGRLTKDWGYSSDKVIVIRNGVSWQDYERDEGRGAAFRRRYSIPQDAFVFGMMTRLSEEKGIDIALKAFNNVIRTCPSRAVRLVITGTGPLEERLKEQAGSLGLQDLVVFAGFAHNAADVLSGYDAILFPSRVEGLPLALLEGMAAGCIPIVSRIGGMPEAVNSRDIGWIVPPENSDALSSAMHSVLVQNDFHLLRARKSATQRVREAFDIEQCHQRIFETCGL
jgi:glycosyltransferase involved in cell wall biosynthesis